MLTRRARAGLLAATALLLTGCGSGESESGSQKDGDAGDRSAATPSASAPTSASTGASASGSPSAAADDTEVTEPGTKLQFGQAATVEHRANAQRGSTLALTVSSVTQGRIADLASYQLDAQTRTTTPYYVRVAVQNLGDGDLGRAAVPLWAVDSRNTLVQASSFTNTFTRCPSQPLPASFGAGAKAAACLVYLLPQGVSLSGVSYRPAQEVEPITWTGTVSPPRKRG